MTRANLVLMGRKSHEDFSYQLTDRGARILELARQRKRISFRALARSTGLSSTVLFMALSGEQMSCKRLPEICRRLEVPFFETQPLLPDQIRILEQLERLRPHGPHTIEAALAMFETYVRGAAGPDEVDDSGPPTQPTPQKHRSS